MFQLIASILAWFYGLTHNYAIAIALLTLVIMVALTPLTLKGTKSMLEMQRLQPEVRRLQNQYKGDRQKMNEELMKLYQEHKINPLGGCLPLLLQAPIFIILFRVLRKLTEPCTAGMHASGKCDAVINGVKKTADIGTFVPSYVKHSTQLFQDLFGQTKMMAFGLNLAEPATKVISESFIKGIPYLILVLFVAATSYYQQRQISARTSSQVANPQQQMIMKVLPAVFAVISLTFPAGLIVYFLVSNLYRIAQNAYITRRFYHDLAAGGDGGDQGAKPTKPPAKPAPTGTVKDKPKPSGAPPTRPAPSKGASRVTPRGDRPAPRTRPHPRPTPKQK